MNDRAAGISLLMWRLVRCFWKRIIFFSFCIALGIAFLFAIGNLTNIITNQISAEARTILSADIEVSSYRKFAPEQLAIFENLKDKGHQTTNTVWFASMIRTEDKNSFLGSIKAIQNNFPLYGTLEIDFGKNAKSSLHKNECWIDQSISQEHALTIGDKVFLGNAALQISGIILKEPGRMFNAIAFAPRIMISVDTLPQTNLIQFGSRVRYGYLIAIEKTQSLEKVDALYNYLQQELNEAHLRITTYKNTQTNISNIMERQSYFFLLVSLVTLLVGAVGMSASMTTFLHEQLYDVATFRALGIEAKKIFQLYLGLSLIIGIFGGILGGIFGYVLSTIGLSSIVELLQLNIKLQMEVHWKYLAEGILLSCLLTVLTNIYKIYSLAKVSPMEVIRGQNTSLAPPLIWRILGIISISGLLFLYISYKSRFEIAFYFCLAVLATSVTIVILITIFLKILESITSFLSKSYFFSLRNGIKQLVRQRSRTLTFLLSLTIGFTLIHTLNFVYASLSNEIFSIKTTKIPNIFLADVLKNQIDSVNNMVQKHKGTSIEFSPLIRARLKSINGNLIKRKNELHLANNKKKVYRWRTREYNLTYKDTLNESEKIIAGNFWETNEQKPHISLEQDFAKRANINIGDTLEFDIQGRFVKGKVTSIRKIDWMSMKPNFFVVMPKYILESAPQTIISSFKLEEDSKIISFQKEISSQYPNISVINVQNILQTIQTLVNYFLSALKTTAWFCVIVGIIILIGTLSMGHQERLDQVALLKTMGCNKKKIIAMDFYEFLCIGIISATISIGISCMLTLIHNYILDINTYIPFEIFYYSAFVILLPIVVGLFVNKKIYNTNVMENLREGTQD